MLKSKNIGLEIVTTDVVTFWRTATIDMLGEIFEWFVAVGTAVFINLFAKQLVGSEPFYGLVSWFQILGYRIVNLVQREYLLSNSMRKFPSTYMLCECDSSQMKAPPKAITSVQSGTLEFDLL